MTDKAFTRQFSPPAPHRDAGITEKSKIDMKKLSCKQLSGYDKDNMSIMMWLEGYYTDENEDAVIDFGKMVGDTATHLLVYCGDHPDDDIISAAEEVLGN
jgi:hypothetical protein